MAKRKSFALRIDSKTFEAMQRWARDDLRSLNGQIEYVLREAMRQSGRLPKRLPEEDGAGSDNIE